eukprot:2302300-Rhodomonas_salina.1
MHCRCGSYTVRLVSDTEAFLAFPFFSSLCDGTGRGVFEERRLVATLYRLPPDLEQQPQMEEAAAYDPGMMISE